MAARPSSSPPAGWGRSFAVLSIVLVVVLGWLFRDSFDPDKALFANDGPLGAVTSRTSAFPEGWLRIWSDLNWLGFDGGSMPPTWNYFLLSVLGPRGFINFSPAIASLVLGLSVWLFCRTCDLRPTVAVLAGLAAALNSDFFSYACWGLPTLTVCVASVFLALSALAWRAGPVWLRCCLAGAALGHALMEGFDNGAIFSLYVAAFAVAQTWWQPGGAGVLRRLGRGVAVTAGVAVASAILAAHILVGLFSANIAGAVGMGQDRESKEARWSFITQWSLPPRETLRAVVPGLYGYRLDTPDGGQYWGNVGMHPALDEYWKSSPRDPSKRPPPGAWRSSGAGHYAGVLVVLLAAFAVAQSFRKGGGVYTPAERRWVWFWAGAALVSLLFAFGRFAPFYRIIYALPYFDTIRNPIKFLHPFNVALVMLFAYGGQALWRGWLERATSRDGGAIVALKAWWRVAQPWERRWTTATLILTAVAVFAWLAYGTMRGDVVAYLVEVGFDHDPKLAQNIVRFSQREVGLAVVVFAAAAGLVVALLSGWLAGDRARYAGVALGSLLVLDLARANVPWILHYPWRERYATNPLFDVLRAAPHEARVSGRMPFALGGAAGQALDTMGNVYGGEWHQHQFRFYDIQCLEVVQLPRPPADYTAWMETVHASPVREWELSNTRYLLALAPLVEPMNQQFDPVKKRFRLHTAFQLSQGPSGTIQVQTNTTGPYALIEFTGALPRATLFDRWRSPVDDGDALATLVSTNFDPQAEVLVAEQIPAPSVDTATQPAGTARYREYRPTRFVIDTEARTPCVLLVNDRYDDRWRVTVDGKSEPLLRANFAMRGVYLTPGKHEVVFEFRPSHRTLWVTLAALVASLGLCGYAVRLGLRHSAGGPPE